MCLRSLGHRLQAVLSDMSCEATEHTQLVDEAVLVLGSGELAIFAQLQGNVQLGGTRASGGLGGFSRRLLEVLGGAGGVVAGGSEGRGFVRG